MRISDLCGLGLGAVLAMGQWGCSSAAQGGHDPGASGNAGAVAVNAGASAGGAGGVGGVAAAGGVGGVAASGGAGAGGAAALSYCGSTLAPRRTLTKTKVSDKVFDYKLDGPAGAQHHNVLLLMFNASSKSAATPDGQGFRNFYTPEQLGDVYFNDPNGVLAFLTEASFGKVSLSGRVVGWLDQPTGVTPKAQEFQDNRDMYAQQATPYATLADYDVVYIIGLTDGTDVLQLGWGLQNTLNTSQGQWPGGVDWMINSFFFTQAGTEYPFSTILPSRTWAHELHHTLGIFGHDISLDCGTSTLAAACAFNAYGNVFSVMGESALGNHPSIGMKQALGWLGAGQMQKVSASTQTLICPSESVDGKPKGLEIALKTPLTLTSTTVDEPAVFDRIYVEYRAPLGFDRYLSRLSDPAWQKRFLMAPRNIRQDGVVITLGYADPETQSSALLDMHPTLTDFTKDGIVIPGNVGKFVDAELLVGETFEVPGQGIKITPTAVEGGGIRVNVAY